MTKKQFTHEIGGKTLTLEVSSFAEQANAAVVAKYGDTVVLATAVMGRKESPADYLPLRVDYEERFYAAGKIIGSRFIRREGRPSEEAILTGRLIDRTLRPLFDYRIRRDIQVVVTVLAYDEENEPDFVGLMAASTALAISDIPWSGPVGGVRIGKVENDTLVNPVNSVLKTDGFAFETFASGPAGRINMIELRGNEAQETDIIAAYEKATEEIRALTAFQEKIVAEIGKPKTEVPRYEPAPELRAAAEEFLAPRLEGAIYRSSKVEQYAALADLKKELLAHIESSFEKPDLKAAEFVYEDAVDKTVHKNVLEKEKRPDGRRLTDVRPLEAQVALFERTHGSAFFARGSTQALAVATLAGPGAEQLIETMETTGKKRFMLHYNFPPYSVGEVGIFRGPGRREIGHGALAEKAVRPMLPIIDEFPYAIRVVSEILSSNGSSSQATVCAATLALMDAGVPMKKQVAGIAMGLMMSEDAGTFKVLTDLEGPEDFYGDMDFKIAGTADGVTAIQLDTKVHGITMEIVKATLAQAREARLEILEFMKSIQPKPRETLSKYAPMIIQLKINPEKIGLVIGPGGKMINGMIRDLGLASIDIEEDGSVFISGTDAAKVREAEMQIKALTREFTVGEIVEGRVVKNLEFGAIVDLGGGKDGMIHVSELKNGFVKTVDEVVKPGDFVRAKIISAEDDRIRLSLKQMNEEEKTRS